MKKWLLFFISLIQTILSIVIYNLVAPVFNGGLELQLGLVLFLVVIEVVLALLVSFVIRKYDVILPIILEVILAPLAVFRFVFGLILSLVFQQDFALEYDSSDLLSSVAEYLIYFEVSYKAAISKTGNLISILLFALPITFIMFYSFWNDIFLCDYFFNNFNIELPRYNIVIGIFINLVLTGALCVVRGQSTEYEYYNPYYKFKNEITGRKEKRYSQDYLYLTNKSLERGWVKVSGGYESHLTVEMIVTLILSPFLFFTYVIGLIAAILSYFIYPIYSCIGKIDYDDIPLGFIQKIVHFLFIFVIYPDLIENKEIIKKQKKIFSKKQQEKITAKQPSYAKVKYTSVKKTKSFKNPFKDLFKNIDSVGELIVSILTVIFFPFILIFKGIKILVNYIIDNSDSFLSFILVLLKIIFFPITLIILLIKGLGKLELSNEFKASILFTFLCAVLGGVYFIMGRTGFMAKLAFETDMSWLTSFFSQYYFTKLIATLFEDAGILVILLALLIAVVAILEFFVMILGFILSLVLSILSILLQLCYIILIPIGLIVFAFIIFFKNASETELVGNILAFIFIGICITFVVLYGIDLYGLMFPN